jgi:hypothetical protein
MGYHKEGILFLYMIILIAHPDLTNYKYQSPLTLS